MREDPYELVTNAAGIARVADGLVPLPVGTPNEGSTLVVAPGQQKVCRRLPRFRSHTRSSMGSTKLWQGCLLACERNHGQVHERNLVSAGMKLNNDTTRNRWD